MLCNAGAAYGVLQIAFHNPVAYSPESTISTTELQLYGRISCLFGMFILQAHIISFKYSVVVGVLITVEQLLYDMVRNCRDQVRARTPEKFATLFKVIFTHLLHLCCQTHELGLLVN